MRSLYRLTSLVSVAWLALLCPCVTNTERTPQRGDVTPDLRLRSAGLMRASGVNYGPPLGLAREQARLRSHFDAVLEKLEADTPFSLDVAAQRAEEARGPLSASELQELRQQLAAERARNLSVLRGYRDEGRFPLNREVTERAVPIFVDHRDTACAVGFLMRESGWGSEVAEIAGTDNRVYVDDVRAGPLLAWIATSGLTRQEAALIQPAYAPPPADAVLDELLTSGSTLVGDQFLYSNFAFDALLVEPGAESPAPTSLVDPSRFGITDRFYSLFVGASVVDGIGGLAFVESPFGDDGSQLRITVAYDVELLDPDLGIDGINLNTYDFFILGGNFASEGDLTLESRALDGDALIAKLVADQYVEYGDPDFDMLQDFEEASFSARRKLRVETEAIIRGPAYYTYFIHGFSLTHIPEPSTGALLAAGLLMLVRGLLRLSH